MKGAQLGFTEWALNRCFHVVDVLGLSVLYVLPVQSPDVKDFSSARFDAALELSPYLSQLFGDTKNVGFKRSGAKAVYIRGSRGDLKSIPIACLILDEFEEMNQAKVALAEERLSGQVSTKKQYTLSTPRVEGGGIHKRFMMTDQKEYYFKCPGCSRFENLRYPESFVRTSDELHDEKLKESHYICTQCKKLLVHSEKPSWLSTSQWVPKFPGRDRSGYFINQLYSTTVSPYEIAVKSILAEFDPVENQEFHNSKLGITFTPKDGRILDEHFEQCKANYLMPAVPFPNRRITMGIDVGSFFDYEIDEWITPSGPYSQERAQGRLLDTDSVRDLSDLHKKIAYYKPNKIVIDAAPEHRLAIQFCSDYPGIAHMCYYNEHLKGKNISTKGDDVEDAITREPIVTVNRTSWLDLALARLKNKSLKVPVNLQEKYKQHLKALARVPERDSENNTIYRYREIGPDHRAHARVYSEIALRLTYGGGKVLSL